MSNNKIIDLERLSRFKDKLDDVLETKANVDGNYPTMTVGSADSLTPYGENSGANDTTPFVFQTTGGNSDVGSKAYLRELRGNSVAFNQINSNNYYNGGTVNGITFVKNADGSWTISGTASASVERVITSFPITANHKYLLKGCPSGGSTNSYWLACGQISQDDIGSGIIGYRSSDTTGYIAIRVANGTAISGTLTFKPQQFDLTLMIGSGNEPTSVLEFNRDYPKPYYPYNAGTLLSCKVNGIKNVGYNALSLDRTEGTTGSGSNTTLRNFEESKYYPNLSANNYAYTTATLDSKTDNSITVTGSSGYGVGFPVRIVPGMEYSIEYTTSGSGTNEVHFSWYSQDGNWLSNINVTSTNHATAPDNAYWCVILFRPSGTLTYSNICFHLTWDGSRTGYEQYYSETYALPNVELRSVPDYVNGGQIRDILEPNGTLTRKVGIVDLGTLTWTYNSTYHFYYSNGISTLIKKPQQTTPGNILSLFNRNVSQNATKQDKDICITNDGDVRVYDSTQSGDPTGPLYYELATPTTTQSDDYKYQEIMPVDDFGTQEFLYDNDITIQVPQGNDFFYPVDYKAFIDSLGGREDIEYDASEIVSHSELSAYDVIDAQLKDAIGGTLRQCVSIKGSIDFNNTTWVDLGTLNWTAGNANGKFYVPLSGIKTATGYNAIPNIACSKYQTGSKNQFDNASVDKIIAISDGIAYIYVYDSGAGTDATTFKNAMKGVLLAYEKA